MNDCTGGIGHWLDELKAGPLPRVAGLTHSRCSICRRVHVQLTILLHACRRWWAPTHHNVGRLALLLGFANAIIGAYAAHMDYDWYVWICVVWGVIMLIGIPLIIYARMNPRGEAAASEKAPSGAATTTRPHRDAANDTPYV